MKLDDIYKNCKINWTKFYGSFDEPQNDSQIKFEIMPEEFLEFAKNNIKTHTKQSTVDAIGNAKKAIESQIDLLISTLGFDYKKFDDKDSYPVTKKYIKSNYIEENYDGIVPRIKLLNILGLAPSIIISEIRSLRNKVEHNYIVPSLDSVKKAIEIAELFINSSNRKFSYSPMALYIGNELSDNVPDYCGHSLEYPYISIFCSSTDKIVIKCFKNDNDKIECTLGVDEEKYIECIEILLKEDSSLTPKIFGYEIPKNSINVLDAFK